MKKQDINKLMKKLRPSKAEILDEKRRQARQDREWKKDTRVGYWGISGIRHCAIVRAKSAFDAVQKALSSGRVGDWECPRPVFIGKKFPDFYSY